MHRWRYPSLSLHGIEGAFSGSGAKTVIPRKVVGKFSIRLVPNMTPEVVSEQVHGQWDSGRGLLCTGKDSGAKRFSSEQLKNTNPKPYVPTSWLWPTQ